MRLHLTACAVVLAGVLLSPASALAVTIDEVVALTKAGVSDQVMIAMIDRDRTIFTIDADELVRLRAAGVSEPVVLAMLRSGREPAAVPPAAPAAEPAAARVEPILPPPADLVVVGHDPDVPDTSVAHPAYYAPVIAVVPWPVLVPVGGRGRHHRRDGVAVGTLPASAAPISPFHVGPGLPPSPFHVGPELPPSPFHVGPTFPPFGVPTPPAPPPHRSHGSSR